MKSSGDVINRGVLTLFAVIFSLSLAGQEQDNRTVPQKADTSLFKSEKYIAKTGYSLAPLPEFMIDPFIGLYLGVNAIIYDYGDGKIYPNYYRSLNILAAHGTKGKTNFGLEYYDYGRFLLYAKASYTISTLYPFYGYNGYQAVYREDYHNDLDDSYITAPFYNYNQKVGRLTSYIQDTITGTFFNWQVGFDIAYYSASRVNFSKVNKGVADSLKAPDVPTLYDRYITWGLIDEEEKDGGWANALRAAMVYDTRDRITNPMHGIWTDLTVRYTPSFLGNRYSAVQLAFTHRQYFTLISEKLSFAYRLRYDACFGDLPFYTRHVLADGNEGIGGTGVLGTGTLWGIHQNRIMTRQFATANFELRAKLVRFRFISQNWYLAAVPLFHAGYLIEPVDLDLSGVSPEDIDRFFSSTDKRWYTAYGLGGKLVMNENTVIGLDWVHALDPGAGDNAVYVGFGYTF